MTSTIGTPVWISRTAWYRCSMRLRSIFMLPEPEGTVMSALLLHDLDRRQAPGSDGRRELLLRRWARVRVSPSTAASPSGSCPPGWLARTGLTLRWNWSCGRQMQAVSFRLRIYAQNLSNSYWSYGERGCRGGMPDAARGRPRRLVPAPGRLRGGRCRWEAAYDLGRVARC